MYELVTIDDFYAECVCIHHDLEGSPLKLYLRNALSFGFGLSFG